MLFTENKYYAEILRKTFVSSIGLLMQKRLIEKENRKQV